MHSTRFIFGALTTAGLVAAAAAAALALPGGGSDGGSITLDRLGDPNFKAKPISATPADLKASFSVLAKPADGLPAGIAAQLGQGTVLTQTFAPNPSLARRVRVTSLPSEQSLWVIPGRDSVCLYVPDTEGGGLSCQASDDAARGALVVTLFPPSGPATVAGLAPDGVDEVTLFEDNGGAVAGLVHDNVYAATADRPAALTVGSSTIPVPRTPAPPATGG